MHSAALLMLIMSGLGSAGCKAAKDAAPPAPDQVLVWIDGQPRITRADFERELMKVRGPQAGELSNEDRQKTLDGMIDFEVLALAAERAGMGSQPEVREIWKNKMVELYLRQIDHSPAEENQVPDAEVEEYFSSNQEEYQKPPMRRLQEIVIRKTSAQSRQQAEALLQRAKKASFKEFRTLAIDHTQDQAGLAQGGDLGWVVQKDPEHKLGPEVLSAAWAAGVGDATLVETNDSFRIIRVDREKTFRQMPANQIKTLIKAKLRSERIKESRSDLVEDLRDDVKIKIDKGLLKGLPAPNRTGGGPPSFPVDPNDPKSSLK